MQVSFVRRCLSIFLALGFVPFACLQAVDFTVNSLADMVDALPGNELCSAGGKICTLRAAIQETNALATDDTITLPAGHYTLTISGTDEDAAATGDLDITGNLVIQGAGADQTIVDAAGLDRVFQVRGNGVEFGVTVQLQMLTVTGGEALGSSSLRDGTGGGILVDGGGGLGLDLARVSDNAAFLGGGVGGLGWAGLEILNSEVTRNESRDGPGFVGSGAGLFLAEGSPIASVQIWESTISHNGCLTQLAAECVGGVSVSECGNPPGDLEGLNVVNSTVSQNEGHGLSIESCTTSLKYATVYGNTGSGVRITGYGAMRIPPPVAHAHRSIFAHNGIADCDLSYGFWTTADANLSSDDTCALTGVDDQINTDPELYPLGYYAPPAPRIAATHHSRWGAPVVDKVQTFFDQAKDQDGFDRDGDGNGDGLDGYDIGSIESQPCVVVADRVFMNQTLFGGTVEACNTITADPNVIINGAVSFDARDSVRLGDGFEVTAGSEFSVLITRDAGAP